MLTNLDIYSQGIQRLIQSESMKIRLLNSYFLFYEVSAHCCKMICIYLWR